MVGGCARLQLGGVLGGAEGERVRAAAITWLEREGGVDPGRFSELLVPGFRARAGAGAEARLLVRAARRLIVLPRPTHGGH